MAPLITFAAVTIQGTHVGQLGNCIGLDHSILLSQLSLDLCEALRNKLGL